MKYLDNSDNVFLSAECAGTSMTVAGTLQLIGCPWTFGRSEWTCKGLAEVKGAVDRKRLERDLERLADGAERFRQRLVLDDGPFARAYWVPVGDDFDVRDHLTIQPMPPSLESMHDAIGQLMETPLSYDVPLWHVTCFEGPQTSYLLIRLSVSR